METLPTQSLEMEPALPPELPQPDGAETPYIPRKTTLVLGEADPEQNQAPEKHSDVRDEINQQVGEKDSSATHEAPEAVTPTDPNADSKREDKDSTKDTFLQLYFLVLWLRSVNVYRKNLSNPRSQEVDVSANDRPAALDSIRPLKPTEQKPGGGRGRGRGKGKGKGRGGRGKVESKTPNDEADFGDEENEDEEPRPKKRRTRKKETQEEDDEVEDDTHEGKVGKAKASKAGKVDKKAKVTSKDKAAAAKAKAKISKGLDKVEKAKDKTPKPDGTSSFENQASNEEAKPKSRARKPKPSKDLDKHDEKASSSKDKAGKTKGSSSKVEKASGSKDVPASKKRKGKGTEADQAGEDEATAYKAKLSRKSAAYHKAKTTALKEGKSPDEAKQLGREVTCTKLQQNFLVQMICTICSLHTHESSNLIDCFWHLRHTQTLTRLDGWAIAFGVGAACKQAVSQGTSLHSKYDSNLAVLDCSGRRPMRTVRWSKRWYACTAPCDYLDWKQICMV